MIASYKDITSPNTNYGLEVLNDKIAESKASIH
jgi:hypothetical protein